MGKPTDGHQCYKQMSVDLKFCLDAKLIGKLLTYTCILTVNGQILTA